MKKLLMSTIAVLSVGLFYGQSVEPDARLEVKFSKTELENLEKYNPKELMYLNYCIENAFVIDVIPSGKRESPEILGVIGVDKTDDINFFDLDISIHKDERSYYLIENTNKLIMVYSENEIKQKLKTKN